MQALPAVHSYDDRAPLEVTQNPEIVAPKQKKTTIVLLAGPEAPLTTDPRTVQLHCRPIVNGQLGPSLLVREIPLMVVEGPAPKEGETPSVRKMIGSSHFMCMRLTNNKLLTVFLSLR